MVFVKRDATGQVVAVSREPADGFVELLDTEEPAYQVFLATVGQQSELAQSDLAFVRVLDDLLAILLEKNVLMFTDLPPEAQQKITERNQLRAARGGALDILDDEGLI